MSNSNISLLMALVDFLPVVMFFISAVLLQRDLYDVLSKGRFALLSAGAIMVLNTVLAYQLTQFKKAVDKRGKKIHIR